MNVTVQVKSFKNKLMTHFWFSLLVWFLFHPFCQSASCSVSLLLIETNLQPFDMKMESNRSLPLFLFPGLLLPDNWTAAQIYLRHQVGKKELLCSHGVTWESDLYHLIYFSRNRAFFIQHHLNNVEYILSSCTCRENLHLTAIV